MDLKKLKDLSTKEDFKNGTVILAGSGPGDPKLITLKVFLSIKTADVIIYDALVNSNVLKDSKKNATLIFAGKRSLNKSCSQEDIFNWMIKYAKMGKKVLRLKGGDPSVFGRGAEEINTLKKNNIPFKIFSGITAAQESFSSLKSDYILSNDSFLLITGHKAINKTTPDLNFEALANYSGKIIIYMGLSRLNFIAHNLIDHGKNKNSLVQIVSKVSLNEQVTFRRKLLECCIPKELLNIKSPAIIIIN